MLLALPVMAEDAVTRSTPITPEDLVSDVTDKAATEKWTWDVDTKTLVLKNGFVMDVYDDDDDVDGITVPEGTTIVVEGKAKITVSEDAIDVEDMVSYKPAEAAFNEETCQPLKILLRANADLTLYAGSDGIVTHVEVEDDDSYYTDLIITGENRTTSKLTVYNVSGDEGIQGETITIDTCTVKVHVDEECIYAYNDITIRNSIVDVESDDQEGIYTAGGNVIIEDSTLDLTSTGYYEDEYYYECYEGIYAYENVTISNSNVTIESGDECIYAAEGDIKITGSTLNLESKYSDGIDSGDGYIIIDSCKITLSCENECIEAEKYITITNTSLDLCSTTGNGIFDLLWKSENLDVIHEMYQNNISLDCKFILYGENDKRLHNNPIEYSADLIVSDLDSGEDTWYYNNERVYRLVTANEVDEPDTTASIEKVFRSLRTVSFSGEGTSALKELYRAFGSTVNLNKFVPAAREGYTFTGWYADAACTKPITRLVVTGDMEIYAGWEAIAVEEETEAEEENN